MPLSEHEQRLLDQIERQLYAEDPKFASAVRSHDVKTHLTRRVKRFAALLALGLVALVAGAVLRNVYVGVAGFLVMLAAGLVIARSLQRLSRGETLPKLKDKRKQKARGEKTSLRERAEERFRRRFDDPDR
ncbi:MAG TPA: DUF3040 domain-containing protein [Frankiaceae bacterium]|nr:DUF3040 domain-containing protein [Frankiaceae bacterium]